MSNEHINIIWYQSLRMVICQTKELNTINLTFTILKEVYIVRQIFNAFSLPKAKVMITSYEDFVRIG